MKVHELISLLKEYPENADIVVIGSRVNHNFKVSHCHLVESEGFEWRFTDWDDKDENVKYFVSIEI